MRNSSQKGMQPRVQVLLAGVEAGLSSSQAFFLSFAAGSQGNHFFALSSHALFGRLQSLAACFMLVAMLGELFHNVVTRDADGVSARVAVNLSAK